MKTIKPPKKYWMTDTSGGLALCLKTGDLL